MSEHRPEVEWVEDHRMFWVHCIYPWSCTWQTGLIADEETANAAAKAHLDQTTVVTV